MIPLPHQIGTTILGAGEYAVLYLIIMLSGPVALGTIIINQKDFFSLDCIPNCIDCENSTLLKPNSAAYVNNVCAADMATLNEPYVIGSIFCIFVTIFILGTSMVPQACLDQVFKEFNKIDSDSASKIVSVMEILTRDEIHVDETTDQRVVAIARHIQRRTKAGKGFLIKKRTLARITIFVLISLIYIIFVSYSLVKHYNPLQPPFPTIPCTIDELDGSRKLKFACSLRSYASQTCLMNIKSVLLSLLEIYLLIQLFQLVNSFCYVRVIGCCASRREKADYLAVEEARWLFRTRFGYDYKPEPPVQEYHEPDGSLIINMEE